MNAVGHFLIALSLRAAGDKAHVPAMHLMQIGIAALREGAQQVERGGCLQIAFQHTLRIRHTGGFVKFEAVDDIAAIARQLDAAYCFRIAGAWLGELPGETADLHNRAVGAIGQHHRHLQQHLEGIADVVGVKFGKAFGAIAALQQKRAARGHIRQLFLKASRLTCKYQRRKGFQLRLDRLKGLNVRICRQLADGFLSPAIGGPAFRHLFLP